MQRQNRINFESAIAKAMLEKVQNSLKIKQILAEIANQLRSEVLRPQSR